MTRTKHLRTRVLDIAYEEAGEPEGEPIVLVHGFPDDVRAWDDVIAPLVAAGYRTLAPYLRGFGPTRFLDHDTPRSGQLAALAADLIDFADGLDLRRFALVGHDWGARAAQAVAALRPERVKQLISLAGYEITWGEEGGPPPYPQLHAMWYQFLLRTDLGPALLKMDRHGFCRYLWETWSPGWRFTNATFAATAPSFDNPDFAAIVVHAYRHPQPDAPGDPRYEALEEQLAAGPPIAVPTIVLLGEDDAIELPGPTPPPSERHFTGDYERRLVPGAGHFPHRERPEAVVAAVVAPRK